MNKIHFCSSIDFIFATTSNTSNCAHNPIHHHPHNRISPYNLSNGLVHALLLIKTHMPPNCKDFRSLKLHNAIDQHNWLLAMVQRHPIINLMSKHCFQNKVSLIILLHLPIPCNSNCFMVISFLVLSAITIKFSLLRSCQSTIFTTPHQNQLNHIFYTSDSLVLPTRM